MATTWRQSRPQGRGRAQVERRKRGQYSGPRRAFCPRRRCRSHTARRTIRSGVPGPSWTIQEIVGAADFKSAAINNPEAIETRNTRLAVIHSSSATAGVPGSKANRLGRDASLQDGERTRQETVCNVIKAYLVLLARESHKVALKSLETSTANVKLAEARYRARRGPIVRPSPGKGASMRSKEMVTFAPITGPNWRRRRSTLRWACPGQNMKCPGALAPRKLKADVDVLIQDPPFAGRDLLSMGLNRRNARSEREPQARTDYPPILNLMGQVDWNSGDPPGMTPGAQASWPCSD